jgi:hypothetical protein
MDYLTEMLEELEITKQVIHYVPDELDFLYDTIPPSFDSLYAGIPLSAWN